MTDGPRQNDEPVVWPGSAASSCEGVTPDRSDLRALRQDVIRRVRYATNTLALMETRLPPEGPFDAAITNGLLAIVSAEWPGKERQDGEFLKPARKLLRIIQKEADPSLSYVAVDYLHEGLDLTQPFRHGRADDEFATINSQHIAALERLDRHPALRILDKARTRSVDDCLWLAFEERAEEYLPVDLKDRLNVPEPELCDDCGRPTFLPGGWDAFGGTSSLGVCIACGYQRSDRQAWDNAIAEAIERGAWD